MNMRDLGQIFKYLIIILVIIYGCKPEHSQHEIINVDREPQDLTNIYITYLKEQIETDPEVSDNYIKLASIYEKQSRKELALTLLQKASRQTHNETRILLELGKLYLENQEIEKLSEILKTIRQNDPENIDFLKLSAGYALLRKDYTNAIFFANRALLSNPYDDESIYLLASAKLINNDSLTALQHFEEAYQLKSSGNNFSGLFHLSLALDLKEEARDYLIEFEKANQDTDCCYFWGAYFNVIDQKDSARSILRNCEEEKYSDDRINYELAKTFNLSTTDSVLHYINLYLEDQPESIPGLVFKAKSLERISYYTEARRLYEHAIKIDSTSRLATQGLDKLERKVAYLRLIRRKESVQKDLELFKPLNSKEIN
jgi:hypothetical protein